MSALPVWANGPSNSGAPGTGTGNQAVPKVTGLKSACQVFRFFAAGDYRGRKLAERKPDVLSDHDFLDQARYVDEFGLVASKFDTQLDTRIYYTTTGKPDANGEVPVVDPDAKALFIYFHGTGTENGSGANWNYKANRLAKMGFASLAFDYPFHEDGPTTPANAFPGIWLDKVNQMIKKYRKPGQPIYLVGHSFGVDAIAEYLYRYPRSPVTGALLMSPGGVDKKLQKWQQEKTMPMLRYWPSFEYNELGSRWAGLVRNGLFGMVGGFVWNMAPGVKPRRDPTEVNPNLKVRVLTGEWEEYVPGPLDERGLPAQAPRTYPILEVMRKHFGRMSGIIEPKVGHLVFKHTDAEGRDLVLREALGITGHDWKDIEKLQNEFGLRNNLAPHDRIMQAYLRDPFFREWADRTQTHAKLQELHRTGNEAGAKEVLEAFKHAKAHREKLLLDNVRATQTWAPEFYAKYKALIDKYEPAKRDSLLVPYFEMLAKMSPEDRARYASVTPEAYANVPPPQQTQGSFAGSGDQIFDTVKRTQQLAPGWYKDNETAIQAAETDTKKRGRLIAAYKRFLQELTPEQKTQLERGEPISPRAPASVP